MGRLFLVDMEDVLVNKNHWEPYVCSQCNTFIASATDSPGWKVVGPADNPGNLVVIPEVSFQPTDRGENIYRVEGTFAKAVNVWTSDDHFKENKDTLVEVYCNKCCHHLGKKYVRVEDDDNRVRGAHAGWYELILEWHGVRAAMNMIGQQ